MFDEALYCDTFRAQLCASWALACRGRPAEAFRAANAVRRRAEAASDAFAAAFALQQMAWTSFQMGEVERGLGFVQTAHSIWTQAGRRSGIVWTMAMNAWLLLECGMSELASEKAVEAFNAASEADEATRCFATNVLGVVFWSGKHLERASALCLDAVASARRLNDPVLLGWWLINLGCVTWDRASLADTRGDRCATAHLSKEALAINQEAIDIAEREGDVWGLKIGLCNAAEYLMSAGRQDDALAHVARCEAIGDTIGSRSLSQLFYTKTQVLIHFNRLDEALEICEAALELSQRQGNTDSTSYALRYLSEIHERAGRFETALVLFKRFHAVNLNLAGEQAQRRARIAEIVYENGRFQAMVEETRRQLDTVTRTSQLDPLTGLLNRRGFDDLMATRLASVNRYSLAIVDLDHFKKVNDLYSHLAGDEVLRRAAALLARSCGSAHHAIRLGGEEFVLVIDTDDLMQAERFCEEVRLAIAENDWSSIHPDLSLTASIGVAGNWPQATVTEVLAAADARLYRAKTAGRNRVVWRDDLRSSLQQAVA